MAEIAEEIGPDRTGLRLSPVSPVNDANQDSDAQGLLNYFLDRLNPLHLAFIHVVEGATGGAPDLQSFDFPALRQPFKRGHAEGAWIVNMDIPDRWPFPLWQAARPATPIIRSLTGRTPARASTAARARSSKLPHEFHQSSFREMIHE